MLSQSYCFITNYLTHHQLPFCLEMVQATGGMFTFIETAALPEERIKLGYSALGDRYDFVMRGITREERKKAKQIVNNSDVVIIGSAPNWYIKDRLRKGKLTFRCTERIFKKQEHDVLRLIKYTVNNRPYRNKSLFYLFCSAYAPQDFIRCGADENKFFKWGYFPETCKYDDINEIIELKRPASILWTGRLIEWKHPEIAVYIGEQLRANHIEFTMKIIGDGALYDSINNLIHNKNLEDRIEMLGAMTPAEVRKYMEDSEIFLFTSDQNEGWGAVLNEAMNSGCAVITSKTVGAAPYLIQENQNGKKVVSNDVTGFLQATIDLIEDNTLRKRIEENAYHTIIEEWNAKNAANCFLTLCDSILKGEDTPFISGICSKAESM